MGLTSLVLSALPIASAFTAAPAQSTRSTPRVAPSPLCSADLPRRALLSSLASAAALAATAASPAWAGYITNLGIEPTKPADAEKDDELLATKEVPPLPLLHHAKKSLESIKNYTPPLTRPYPTPHTTPTPPL